VGREASGDLHVRGPWIISRYFKEEGGDPLVDGWFPTGDVAKIDADGYMQITTAARTSSRAAASGSARSTSRISPWRTRGGDGRVHRRKAPEVGRTPAAGGDEKPGAEVTKEELLSFFEGKIAKWWTPDDVVFVDAIPLGATARCRRTSCAISSRTTRCPRLERFPAAPADPGLRCSPYGVRLCSRPGLDTLATEIVQAVLLSRLRPPAFAELTLQPVDEAADLGRHQARRRKDACTSCAGSDQRSSSASTAPDCHRIVRHIPGQDREGPCRRAPRRAAPTGCCCASGPFTGTDTAAPSLPVKCQRSSPCTLL